MGFPPYSQQQQPPRRLKRVQAPGLRRFLRSVRFGMIAYILLAGAFTMGAARTVAFQAVSAGLIVGLLGLLRRWWKYGGLKEGLGDLAGGIGRFAGTVALTSLIMDGLHVLSRPGRRR